MEEPFSRCVDVLLDIAKSPEAFFAANPELKDKLCQTTKVLYDYGKFQ